MYATVTDLSTRLSQREIIQLTNPNTVGAIAVNDVVANAAIADGQGLVDSYLGQRVTLPLATVPQVVKTLTLDIAIYYLHTKVGNTNIAESMTAKLYDDAIKQLTRFAKGETTLGLYIPDDVDEQFGGVEMDSEERLFTRQKMGGLT